MKKALDNVLPVASSIHDRALKAFLGFAISYVQSRIIEVPRYIYVPWNDASAPELWRWAAEWEKFSAGVGKKFERVSYGTGQRPLHGINDLSQVYVLGHGAPGATALYKSSQALPAHLLQGAHMERANWIKKELEPLDFSILLARLMADGLSQEFRGSVKIYACSGGLEGKGAVSSLIPTSLQNTSFTNLLANHMRRSGYKECEVVGYTEDLAAPTAFSVLGGRTIALSDDLQNLCKRVAFMETALEAGGVDNVTPEAFMQKYRSQLGSVNLPAASTVRRSF